MGEIRVDFGALENGRLGVQNVFGKLEATLSELERGLTPMLETWTGAAREQYFLCKKDWDSAAAALAEVLDGVGRAVGSAQENYTSTHNATVQIWA